MPTDPVPETIDILLVEDNPGDVRLVREAFTMSALRHQLYALHDGGEALAFLRRQPPFTDAPRPRLILLDLHLPGRNGHEVLAELKADPDLKHIPVLIVSSSQAEQDVLEAYNLHANGYVVKRSCIKEYFQVLQGIQTFWFRLVTLPPR